VDGFENDSAIDDAIRGIKSEMMKTFVTKWSKHKCSDTSQCKMTITFDGIWKIQRFKCCYENVFVKTDFGDIQIGCNESPTRGSYFCTAHRECDLGFRVEGKTLYFKPHEIKTTKNHSS
jgi:hypothetical protein